MGNSIVGGLSKSAKADSAADKIAQIAKEEKAKGSSSQVIQQKIAEQIETLGIDRDNINISENAKIDGVLDISLNGQTQGFNLGAIDDPNSAALIQSSLQNFLGDSFAESGLLGLDLQLSQYRGDSRRGASAQIIANSVAKGRSSVTDTDFYRFNVQRRANDDASFASYTRWAARQTGPRATWGSLAGSIWDKGVSVVGSIADQIVQPLYQVYDLGVTSTALELDALNYLTFGLTPTIDASQYWLSNVGALAIEGKSTIEAGLTSSTLGSIGYNAFTGTTKIANGDISGGLLDYGAVGLNFVGAKGVSSLGNIKSIRSAFKSQIGELDDVLTNVSRIDGVSVRQVACFVAGTPVQTNDGLKPIEKLSCSDKVLSWNELTGKTEFQSVIDTKVTPHQEIFNLKVSKNGVVESFRTTYNHPFWVVGTGWVQAADLLVDNLLIDPEGCELSVVSLERETEKETVYNIEVNNFHTYYIGESNVLVHNDNCGTLITVGGKSGNSAIWRLDNQGRLAEVSGAIAKDFGGAAKGNFRSSLEKIEATLIGRLGGKGYDGGHLIAHRFFKDQGTKNIFPQNTNFNRGSFKTLENDYARLIDTGAELKFSHKLSDFNSKNIPQTITVNTDIFRNGVFDDNIFDVFKNQSGKQYIRQH